MFGWTEAEALGESLGALGLVDQEDRQQVDGLIAALLTGQADRNKSLNRNRSKGGGLMWCEWYNSVLRDDQGALVSVLSIAMDVTERQALEASLREQAARLADADRRKDDFLSMLGHELRNPLAPLRNALELMAMALDERETMDHARAVIDRQAGHLEHLVDDLLDVARITRGSIRLETKPLDVAAVVRESVEAAQPLVRERGHQLDLDLPEQPVMVMGDATRLTQIVTNLINNAAKYTDVGGAIKVTLAMEGNRAHLTVEDNGRGIPSADLPYIFDVFSQGQRPLGRADGGLGLGLALVKQLTEMHGGTVEAQSDGAGAGSRFVISLPVSQPESAESDAAEAATPAPAQSKKRVLLVDDNDDVLLSTRLVMKSLGHAVQAVSAGAQVVDAVREFHPDVVVLDIGLQDIDGIEVARRLADLPERKSMKVIAFSGYSESVVGPDGDLFDAHLLKGSGLDKLKRLLG
jgi:PAS domain S-box-containing protein